VIGRILIEGQNMLLGIMLLERPLMMVGCDVAATLQVFIGFEKHVSGSYLLGLVGLWDFFFFNQCTNVSLTVI
jgi:hypothetical protein